MTKLEKCLKDATIVFSDTDEHKAWIDIELETMFLTVEAVVTRKKEKKKELLTE